MAWGNNTERINPERQEPRSVESHRWLCHLAKGYDGDESKSLYEQKVIKIIILIKGSHNHCEF